MSPTTLLHHLLQQKEKNKDRPAIQFKSVDRWLSYTWREYYSLIEAVGAGLHSLGLEPQDRVAILSNTRPEWSTADLAIMGMGGITVPIYPNNLDEDVQFIINDSKTKVIILENKDQLAKWERIRANCPEVKQVVVIDGSLQDLKKYITWSELLSKGRKLLSENSRLFSDRAKSTTLEQIATIVYTSGTTGRPKGVVLAHEQVMSELIDIFNLVTVTHEDTSLSFLPYSHILGRIEAWGNVYAGYLLSFAESIDKMKYNLLEIKPTFIIAVPRIFEKIYAGILAKIENNHTKRKIFNRAYKIGLEVSQRLQDHQPLGLLLSVRYEMAKKLVFDNILEALGGRMRFAASGGAALSPDVAKFFHGIGLLICEGYGLTETTAGVFFNSPLAYRFGTVGRPLADVEIRIATDGEILVKSKKVMREYYNNPEATQEVMENGFFKTGDIGYLDKDKFLHITDRKKDLIKTANGKYVAPQKLENLLKSNSVISNVLIHGDQKKYIVALITLTPSYAAKAKSPETYNAVKNIVAEVNTHLASHESIKKFAILPKDFTVETGELTPSLKVKRRYCDQKFRAEIEELY